MNLYLNHLFGTIEGQETKIYTLIKVLGIEVAGSANRI